MDHAPLLHTTSTEHVDGAPVMGPRLTLPVLALLAALTACASAPESHASHGTPDGTARPAAAMCPQQAEMQRHMALVQAATDPAEKERLRAEHRQAMQGGRCGAH